MEDVWMPRVRARRIYVAVRDGTVQHGRRGVRMGTCMRAWVRACARIPVLYTLHAAKHTMPCRSMKQSCSTDKKFASHNMNSADIYI